MNIVDANVLIYAVNRDSRHHQRAQAWLDGEIGEGAVVGLPWVVLLAFIRLTTKPAVVPRPLTPRDAMARVTRWLAEPNVVTPQPTERHADLLTGVLAETGTGGNLVSDAHLATLAIEHGAEVITFDHDFGRFRGVRWREPGS